MGKMQRNTKYVYKNCTTLHRDVLSRLINRGSTPDEDFVIASVQLEQDVSTVLDLAVTELPVTFKRLQTATNKDDTLQAVIQVVRHGWPSAINQVTEEVRPFYAHKDALSIV